MKRVVRQIGFAYYTNKYRMCLLEYFYFVFADFIVVVKFVCGSHDIHNFIDIVRFDNEVAVEYHFFRVSSLMVIFTSNARSKAKAMVSMFSSSKYR